MTEKEIGYTEDELRAIRSEYAKGATDNQFTVFISECKRRNLVPGKHVYFQTRMTKEYDPETHTSSSIRRAIHQTGIDAFRLIAQRSGQYKGQRQPTWIYTDEKGNPNIRSTVPLPEGNTTIPRQPWAAEVSVFRTNFQEPITAVARFEAYAVYTKYDNKWNLNSMWDKRGPEQLAKCAEALALRQAFPEELGGLYLAEEIQDDVEAVSTAATVNSGGEPVHAPTPPVAPTVEHTPAVPTDAPRPNEVKTTTGLPSEVSPPVVVTQPTETMKEFIDSITPEGEVGEVLEFPTKEEKEEYVKRMRVFTRVDLPKSGVQKPAEVLKKWIIKETKIEDTKNLTKTQWLDILSKLDKAKAENRLGDFLFKGE